jgi:hypothetical protein
MKYQYPTFSLQCLVRNRFFSKENGIRVFVNCENSHGAKASIPCVSCFLSTEGENVKWQETNKRIRLQLIYTIVISILGNSAA